MYCFKPEKRQNNQLESHQKQWKMARYKVNIQNAIHSSSVNDEIP